MLTRSTDGADDQIEHQPTSSQLPRIGVEYHLAMTRRIFVDTEWTSPPWSGQAELMWIGLADEEGRSWSAASPAMPAACRVYPAGLWSRSGVARLYKKAVSTSGALSRRHRSAAVRRLSPVSPK